MQAGTKNGENRKPRRAKGAVGNKAGDIVEKPGNGGTTVVGPVEERKGKMDRDNGGGRKPRGGPGMALLDENCLLAITAIMMILEFKKSQPAGNELG